MPSWFKTWRHSTRFAVSRPLLQHRAVRIAALALATLFAFVLQGYHPGAEDDGIYLSAIKKDLTPSLYPYNSGFVTVQLQATVFDKVIAGTCALTHVPIAYACLLWQLGGIGLLLWACARIAGQCFPSRAAQAAGVLTVACVLSLSVAGTALYLSDEHLHPRLIATVAILFAIDALQRERKLICVCMLTVAFLFHPLMTMFGVSFCAIFRIAQYAHSWKALAELLPARAVAFPGAFLFTAAGPGWKEALAQHRYFLLSRWTWYEWLGAIAPPILLFLLTRLAHRRGNRAFFQLSLAVCVFSSVQFLIALLILLPSSLQRLEPLQPMRYLHLTFLLMALLGGAVLGEFVLRTSIARWVLVFLPLAALNGYAQRLRYPATPNLELPWQQPGNAWVRCFVWIRHNTPENAVFALDPHYLSLPGEDNHSFRALAERASLADDEKDSAVVTQAPGLAKTWLQQHREQAGWPTWTYRDFLRLARTTPVRWVVVQPGQAGGLHCPYTSPAVEVCRLPQP